MWTFLSRALSLFDFAIFSLFTQKCCIKTHILAVSMSFLLYSAQMQNGTILKMDPVLYTGLAFLYGIIFILLLGICCFCCFFAVYKRYQISRFFSGQNKQPHQQQQSETHIYDELEECQQEQFDDHIYEDIEDIEPTTVL